MTHFMHSTSGGGSSSDGSTPTLGTQYATHEERTRLDGDHVDQFAKSFRSEVKSVDGLSILKAATPSGVEGREYVIKPGYTSWSIAVLRETVADSFVNIGQGRYKIGAGAVAATVLPYFHTSSKDEVGTQEILVIAEPGCFIEILVTRSEAFTYPED